MFNLEYYKRKYLEYFFCVIDIYNESKIVLILEDDRLKKLYYNMNKYDRYHSLKVYEKLSLKKLPKIYLKLALIHDVGKNNAIFLKRVFHKWGYKTSLINHAKIGYEYIKDIDAKLAKLVLLHHSKTEDKNMKIFQEVDNEN